MLIAGENLNKKDDIENLTPEDDQIKIEETLEDEIDVNNLIKRKSIRYTPENYNIRVLKDLYENGELILHPPYQRNYVWDKTKASNLIESILLDIPIPPIFVTEINGSKKEVIDGQQRLKSILSFMSGRFPTNIENEPAKIFKLSKLKILTKLSGKRFSDLDENIRKRILSRVLQVIVIHSDDDEDSTVKFEMFERLNTGITKLNQQELRNCMYRGRYNDLIKELAEYPDFEFILNNKKLKKRMLDVEYVLNFCAFFNNNYATHYKSSLKQFLNEDMIQKKNIDDREIQRISKEFKKSVGLTKQVFGKKAFRIYTIDEETKRGKFAKNINLGLYNIIMHGFTHYDKNQVVKHSDLIREALITLLTFDEKFIDSLTGSGTTSRKKMTLKFDIWNRTLRDIIGKPETEKRTFSIELKRELFNKNNICKLCGNQIIDVEDSEIDHIICFWKGGKTIPENAQLVHRFCNRHKGGNT